MTHILEDLTYKMGQVNPPKKEVSWVHPWKLTWNLKMGPLEEEIPALETIIFRFHGNLQGWGDVFLTYQFPVILMSFLRWQAPLGWGSPRWVERKSPAKHALNKSAHTIHGIFTYIWLIFMVYVSKIPYMDGIGWFRNYDVMAEICFQQLIGRWEVWVFPSEVTEILEV